VFEPLTGEQRLQRLAIVRAAVMDKPANGNRWLEFAQWYLGDHADGRISPYASVGGQAGTFNP
jgi:hypothetical protein